MKKMVKKNSTNPSLYPNNLFKATKVGIENLFSIGYLMEFQIYYVNGNHLEFYRFLLCTLNPNGTHGKTDLW